MAAGGIKPDIYYIILDGDSGMIHLNISSITATANFCRRWKSLGFYAAVHQSNTPRPALHRIFHQMDTLQFIDKIYDDPQNISRAALPGMIRSTARKFLEEQG